MNWSKSGPTVPGWYRFRELGGTNYLGEVERQTGVALPPLDYKAIDNIRGIDIERQEFLHYAVLYRFEDVEWCGPVEWPAEDVDA